MYIHCTLNVDLSMLQCVSDSNFRYTGARVCNHLSHTLTVQFSNGNFRQYLIKRLAKTGFLVRDMLFYLNACKYIPKDLLSLLVFFNDDASIGT